MHQMAYSRFRRHHRAQTFHDYVAKRLSPETLVAIDREVAETVHALRLADLRKAMELTQKDMAAALDARSMLS